MKTLLSIVIIYSGFAARAQTLVIHFDFDRSDLTSNAIYSIDSFMATKKNKMAGTVIKIKGHCDAIGSTGYNDDLSYRRIETVRKYLENNYLDTGMISAFNAYGERRPLNKNKTEKDRLQNRRVEITIMQKGSDQVSAPGKRTLSEVLSDTAIKSGTRLLLCNINFVGGSHEFLPEAYKSLRELLEAMKTLPKLIIEVHGHICCTNTSDDAFDYGTGTYDLSLQRAVAVKKYLVNNGIDAKRISCRGIGHFNPIYPFPEKNDFEMQQNRRVEIQIVSK